MEELVARVAEARPQMSIACLKRSVAAVQALADDLQSAATTQEGMLCAATASCPDVDGAEVTAFANWTKSVSASHLESELRQLCAKITHGQPNDRLLPSQLTLARNAVCSDEPIDLGGGTP